MFYYLKGGRVDYGEEHSNTYGHSQFGRVYERGFPITTYIADRFLLPIFLLQFFLAGHYPQWDEDHPIHFVGHSAGAQVVRVLQQMLADKVTEIQSLIFVAKTYLKDSDVNIFLLVQAFKGYENTSENWIISITSLSGVFNGTTRTYLDGMQ